jgi:hypothetical protein
VPCGELLILYFHVVVRRHVRPLLVVSSLIFLFGKGAFGFMMSLGTTYGVEVICR